LLRFCLVVVLQVSLSPYRREPFLRSTYLGQGAVLEVDISRARCRSQSMNVSLPQNILFSISRLKLCNRIQKSICNKDSVTEFETQFVIKFNFQSISYI
jgi:hypothetical protein